MVEVVDFITRFAKEHWELAQENVYGDLTAATFTKRVAKLEKEFVDYSLKLLRASNEKRKEYRRLKGTFPKRSEPIPLMVVEYRHGKSVLWRCFVSGFRSASVHLAFGSIYTVEMDGGRLVIKSESLTCPECRGAGKVKGRKCPECKGAGYRTLRGSVPDDYGQIIAVRKLQRPDAPDSAARYDAFESPD